jgi:ribosome recycling factor
MLKHPLLKDAEDRMKKALESLHREFATVRTGRPSPALLEHIKVDYYGVPTPIPHLATISVPETNLMVIQPYDKNVIKDIEKAILASDLGLTPSNDGNLIRLTFPPLTEERRQELVKVVRHMAEEARIAIRNIRRETNDEFKKMKNNSEISEDEYHLYLEEVQKLTDKYIEEIDKDLKVKEEEIMTV